jgi:hypothetical protein
MTKDSRKQPLKGSVPCRQFVDGKIVHDGGVL